MALVFYQGVTDAASIATSPGVTRFPGVVDSGQQPPPPVSDPIYVDFTAGWPGAPWVLTRASTGYYFNASGVMTAAANNQPRIDYDPTTLAPRGLMREGPGTNYVRNPRAEGAVVAGALPTHWSFDDGGSAGAIVADVVGVGTDSGMPYVDIRIHGTCDPYAWLTLSFEEYQGIIIASGSSYASTVFVTRRSGNVWDPRLGVTFQEGGYVYTETRPIALGTGALRASRYTMGNVSPNGYSSAVPTLSWLADAGVAYDMTVRIALPQFETGQKAGSSPIIPPAGTLGISTRAGEAITFSLPVDFQGLASISYAIEAHIPDISTGTQVEQPIAVTPPDEPLTGRVDIPAPTFSPQFGYPISIADASSGGDEATYVQIDSAGDVGATVQVGAGTESTGFVAVSVPGDVRVAVAVSATSLRWAVDGAVEAQAPGLPISKLSILGLMTRIDSLPLETPLMLSGWVERVELLAYAADDAELTQMPRAP